jgi:hypothetical protein
LATMEETTIVLDSRVKFYLVFNFPSNVIGAPITNQAANLSLCQISLIVGLYAAPN